MTPSICWTTSSSKGHALLKDGQFRDVIDKPEPVMDLWIERENYTAGRYPAQFGESGRAVRPMVDGQNCHDHVKCFRPEGHRLCHSTHDRVRAWTTLTDHHFRRF